MAARKAAARDGAHRPQADPSGPEGHGRPAKALQSGNRRPCSVDLPISGQASARVGRRSFPTTPWHRTPRKLPRVVGAGARRPRPAGRDGRHLQRGAARRGRLRRRSRQRPRASAPSSRTGATSFAAQGEDPFGDTPTQEISKSKLDKMLAGADPLAAGLVHTAVEEYRRRARHRGAPLPAPEGVAGHRAHRDRRRVRAPAISASWRWAAPPCCWPARTSTIELRTIANHPDKAGLIGAVQLAPSWVLAGHDAILAADIGGTNLAGRRRRAQHEEGRPVEGRGVEAPALAAPRRPADARAGAGAHGRRWRTS